MQYNPLTKTFLLALVLLAYAQPSRAHHSPSEVIEALTQRIDAGEQTSKLLVRRADEYRALGKPKLAIADYQVALESKADYSPAIYGLAKALLAQKEYQAALKTTQRGIQTAPTPDQAASYHAIAAQAHEKLNNGEAASAAWDQALISTNPKVDWFLSKASLLQQMGNHQQARQSLESAIQKNPSTVLHRAWLEALIQCGDTATAAPHIEAGLERSRWKSSWLLLRARLHVADKNTLAAHQDAQAALQEINTRLNPNSENPYLNIAREKSLTILQQTTSSTSQPALQ
jgi:tetratricopeptide (TPR) repeat protein